MTWSSTMLRKLNQNSRLSIWPHLNRERRRKWISSASWDGSTVQAQFKAQGCQRGRTMMIFHTLASTTWSPQLSRSLFGLAARSPASRRLTPRSGTRWTRWADITPLRTVCSQGYTTFSCGLVRRTSWTKTLSKSSACRTLNTQRMRFPWPSRITSRRRAFQPSSSIPD